MLPPCIQDKATPIFCPRNGNSRNRCCNTRIVGPPLARVPIALPAIFLLSWGNGLIVSGQWSAAPASGPMGPSHPGSSVLCLSACLPVYLSLSLSLSWLQTFICGLKTVFILLCQSDKTSPFCQSHSSIAAFGLPLWGQTQVLLDSSSFMLLYARLNVAILLALRPLSLGTEWPGGPGNLHQFWCTILI